MLLRSFFVLLLAGIARADSITPSLTFTGDAQIEEEGVVTTEPSWDTTNGMDAQFGTTTDGVFVETTSRTFEVTSAGWFDLTNVLTLNAFEPTINSGSQELPCLSSVTLQWGLVYGPNPTTGQVVGSPDESCGGIFFAGASGTNTAAEYFAVGDYTLSQTLEISGNRGEEGGSVGGDLLTTLTPAPTPEPRWDQLLPLALILGLLAHRARRQNLPPWEPKEVAWRGKAPTLRGGDPNLVF